jgi:hypothetical protein
VLPRCPQQEEEEEEEAPFAIDLRTTETMMFDEGDKGSGARKYSPTMPQ